MAETFDEWLETATNDEIQSYIDELIADDIHASGGFDMPEI